MPPAVDFVTTWIALSNSFWNPFIYWSLNRKFRRISRNIVKTKVNATAASGHSSSSSSSISIPVDRFVIGLLIFFSDILPQKIRLRHGRLVLQHRTPGGLLRQQRHVFCDQPPEGRRHRRDGPAVPGIAGPGRIPSDAAAAAALPQGRASATLSSEKILIASPRYPPSSSVTVFG